MSNSTDSATRRAQLSPERRAILERWTQGRHAQVQHVIPRRPVHSPTAPSFAQERLWLIERLLGRGNVYNTVPTATAIHGPLDVALLERSLNEVVRRHESLRTTFSTVDGQPAQLIAPAMPITLSVIDLRHLPQPEAEAIRQVRDGARQPFDLAHGPLLCARLFRLDTEHYILLLIMHHLVTDGWSSPVLLQELTTIYKAFRVGLPSPLPPLPIQYADYALWQRQWLQGGVLESQLEYWRRQMADVPATIDLPIDHPRPPVQSFAGASHQFELSHELTASLKAIGQREGATLFMTILAALTVLLFRYSGQPDIVIGSPIANRTLPETRDLIGCFINTVALRLRLFGNPTFRELLARVREVTQAAYAHQDLPFERLVEELQPQRDLSRHPLFQVMFTLQVAAAPARADEVIQLSPVEVDNGVAKFDLTVDLSETAQGLRGIFLYDASLFDAPTRERMLGHFQTLLAGVAAQPDQRLADLPLLPAAERRQLLSTWNATARPCPACGIHQLVEAQVARTPQATAVAAPDGDLSYAELNARANQLAGELRARGAGPDSLVGLCVTRSRDLIIGILGILKAGAAYLPLDPTYPPDRLALMLEDAQVTLLVTQRGLSAQLPPQRAHQLYLDDLPVPPPDPRPAPAAPGFTPAHLAYVIYTSGSSGRPKGVMIPHIAVTNMMAATLEYVRVTPDDVVLQFATFCFDVSVLEIFAALCSGARLLIPPRDTLLSPRALTELLQRERVSFCDIPPAVLELLPADAFPALRTQFIGCESFSGELVTRWIQPGRRLINGYGPTEATVMMTLMECTGTYAQMPPIGYPMANQQVYVLDSQRQPTPIGVPGELYIGGLGLARGYLNRPELTAERFVPNPFAMTNDERRRTNDEDSDLSCVLGPASCGRLYRTGDLVRYRTDGALEFLGRVDQQVKLRGYRIELGEIEAALSQHPAVQQAITVIQSKTPARSLVAYLLAQNGATIDTQELRSWLGQRLPAYMLPALFVQLERFPLMPNGKVDRAALPEPNDVAADRDATFAAPRTALEQMLAGGVFAQVLGVDKVGIHDNFFELGGNSLQAAQVQSSLMDNLQIDVPLTTIFQSPTIAQLSEHIDALALATHGLQPIGDGDAAREEGEL
jgi:amino acid adenylation domain-containing protein